MQTVLTLLSITLYLLAGGLVLARLRQGALAEGGRKRLVPIVIGLVACLLHARLVQQAIFLPHGLDLEFFNVLSLVALLVTALLLLAALGRPVESLGVLILPLAAGSVAAQALWPSQPNILAELDGGIQSHILLSIVAYALLSIAAVQAILLAIQDAHLRNRHPAGFVRALPPLETMESLLFQMIALGFALLSLSLLTGARYLEDIFAQHLVHKTVLSLIAWVVFAVLLWGRLRYGWRGQVAIRWTLGGFVTLMLAYFGSKLVLELILGA